MNAFHRFIKDKQKKQLVFVCRVHTAKDYNGVGDDDNIENLRQTWVGRGKKKDIVRKLLSFKSNAIWNQSRRLDLILYSAAIGQLIRHPDIRLTIRMSYALSNGGMFISAIRSRLARAGLKRLCRCPLGGPPCLSHDSVRLLGYLYRPNCCCCCCYYAVSFVDIVR